MSWAVTAISVAVVSSGVAAYSAYSTGQAQKQAAEYQAKVARNNAIIQKQNADYALKMGAIEAEKKRREGERDIKRLRALGGKSGVQLDSGSILDIFAEQEAETEMDVQAILFNADMEARGFNVSAMGYEANAGESLFAGAQAERAGYIGAGASLLSGAERIAGVGALSTPSAPGAPAPTQRPGRSGRQYAKT